MYLKRLELQGFKTFVQKTVLEFVLDAAGRRGITAIVGPNGSGKSNIADAIRWVMGEQSLKLLRGKKSEDVIFSGSPRRARSGFAEATLIIENDDEFPDVPFSEIAVTRRLYRDGQSQYEINHQPVRLHEIVLLLAQCGIGQRTYSVIAQGMVDQVLTASPAERKEFFDEAFGLRPFQLKRHAAIQKIEAARENLRQTEAILQEIEPRLNSLLRQMKRLGQREQVEQELRTLERAYYGHLWHEISEGYARVHVRQEQAKKERGAHEAVMHRLEAELDTLEKAAPISERFHALQKTLECLIRERGELREREIKLQMERKAVRATGTGQSPFSLEQILEGMEQVAEKHEALDKMLEMKELNVAVLRRLVKELRKMVGALIQKWQSPFGEKSQGTKKDVVGQELEHVAGLVSKIQQKIKETESELESVKLVDEKERKRIFEIQHELHEGREKLRSIEERASQAAVESARFETQREAVLAEIRQHNPKLESELDKLQATSYKLQADTVSRLQKLRSQLEWIGSIDPETIKEHEETKTRHEFLRTQTDDLRQSIQGLELVITELDTTIRERSEKAFRELDREFGISFKKLFNGGEAKLIEVMSEPEVDEAGNAIEEGTEEKGFAGIEIQATPPGKRFKAVNLLSGGERALTSIALICAIMATNPSPFVVLDEVDAALDEANSRKFAEIIDSLADKTQFIVVTHNRATMTQANVLYGVTMGDDGVSQLLSVKLEDAEKMKKK